METSQDSPEPHETKQRHDVGHGGGSNDDGPKNRVPLGSPLEAGGPSVPQSNAGNHEIEEGDKRESWWRGFLYDVKFTDVAIVALTVFGVFAAFRANGLIADANKVAREAADAAADATDVARETLEYAQAGEATTEAVAEATKRTADAAKATAEAAAASNRLSAAANATARMAAEATTAVARDTKRYADWAAFTAETQLRAYISVEGTSLTFDSTRQLASATIALRNTGLHVCAQRAASGFYLLPSQGDTGCPWGG